MIKFQLDVTKLDKQRFKHVTRKNGEKAIFADIVLFDRPDDYGNEGFLTQSKEKDEDIKLPILGNWKTIGQKKSEYPESDALKRHNAEKANGYAPAEKDDDLPF